MAQHIVNETLADGEVRPKRGRIPGRSAGQVLVIALRTFGAILLLQFREYAIEKMLAVVLHEFGQNIK